MQHAPESQVAEVFISYAREDQPFVRRLHDALAGHGRKTWVDWEGIPPSALWMAEVRSAIDAADATVFVVSPRSVESGVCREEVEHAASANKRIVPIVREDVEGLPVPEAVAAHNWIFFRDQDDFDAAVEILLGALDTDQEWVHDHTRLLLRAREWESKGRPNSLVLRGQDLKAAERWLVSGVGKEPEPTPLHTQYVLASRRSATGRQRLTVAGVGIALVVAVVLSVFAFVQRQQALSQRRQAEEQTTLAQSRELAAEAEQHLSVDSELSVLLSTRAVELARTTEAVAALRHAVSVSHLRAVLPAGPGEVSSVSYSRDGGSIFTLGADFPGPWRARIWDASAGKALLTVPRASAPAAMSPDGRLIVGTVWPKDPSAPGAKYPFGVWDARDGTLTKTLRPQLFNGTPQFTSDGRLVLVADYDSASRAVAAWLWDTGTGRLLHVLRAVDVRTQPPLTPIGSFSPDGAMAVVAGIGDRDTGFATVFNVKTGRTVATLSELGSGILSGVFSPDGERVLTTALDGICRISDARTGKLLVKLDGHQGPVEVGAFSPDGSLVVTGGDDETARVWDSRTGTSVSVLPHTGQITSVSFNAEGTYVLTASVDTTARVWDPLTGQLITVLAGHQNAIQDASFSPDGRTVVTASGDGTARIWDAGTSGLSIIHGDALSAAFSPDGRTVVTGGTEPAVTDASTGRLLEALRGGLPYVTAVAFSPDGRLVVGGAGNGDARLWDASTGRSAGVLGTRDSYNSGVSTVAFSPDGKLVLTVDSKTAGRVWDADTGTEVLALKADTSGSPLGAAFSPEQTRIVTWDCCGTGIVWDARTGEQLFQAANPGEGAPLPAVATFSPDSHLLLTGGFDEEARLLDATTGEVRATMRGHSGLIRSVAFSPDGRFAVTGSDDKTAWVWDVRTGAEVFVLEPNPGSVRSASFSPDGRWILTAAGNSVLVWDAETGQEVGTLVTQAARLLGASWSPDGGSILSYDELGVAEITACDACLPVEDLLVLAAQRVTRELTTEERRTYLHEAPPG